MFASACALDDPDAATTTMTDEEIRTAKHIRICDRMNDEVQCHARILVRASGEVATNAVPSGLGPAELRSAYRITSSGSSSVTIAIIGSFSYPNAERDLNTYRAQFGMAACTSASGCFRNVDQNGGTNLPTTFNLGWAREAALDLQMATAICPSCKLLLVQASSATFSNLATCVNTAAKLGARAINNSYGGGESGTSSFEPAYNHAGIAITASSGDRGFGVQFPASSPHVVAVGGTSLFTDTNTRGWSEFVWDGAGSGCSGLYSKPSWQHDTGCSRRTIADVSAVADPNTGVAVFAPDTATDSSFVVMGGTSVAAPIIAAVYALNTGTIHTGASDPYAHTSSLFDVTFGSNGSCSPSYLCNGRTGYDGPTGLGTPNGVAAF
jgi:subtilase family serine protease